MTVQELIDELQKVEHKDCRVEVDTSQPDEWHDSWDYVTGVFHGVLEGGGYVVSLELEK